MELRAGTHLGDYVVGATLASGGMGSVYRAEHVALRLPAAIKVLHDELSRTPELVARFEREAQAVSLVRHPNVVDLYETGRLPDGRPFLVMELLHGADLDRHVRRHGRMSPEQVLAVLEPLADALEAAHARGIIHRDVKPSNVFLSEEGRERRVVLLDFGVAKLRSASAQKSFTTERRQLGTPSTMAPEQIRGEAITPRTDVYGLAMVAFHLLTARMPFLGNVDAVEWMHLVARRPRPSALAPLAAALDEPVVRGMSIRPEHRQASPRAFVDSFRAALGHGEARTCRGLAVHLVAIVDKAALDDPDDELCADLEAVLGGAAERLAREGFLQAFEARTTGLWVRPLPPAGALELRERRRAVQTALALSRDLQARPFRDPRVGVALCLHLDEVEVAGDRVRGGELLRVGTWATHRAGEVVATHAVTAGLEGIASCAA
jgi:eukaryotic-like serine/threonine-protein kinase